MASDDFVLYSKKVSLHLTVKDIRSFYNPGTTYSKKIKEHTLKMN